MTKKERAEAFDEYRRRGALELADLMVQADEHAEKMDARLAAATRGWQEAADALVAARKAHGDDLRLIASALLTVPVFSDPDGTLITGAAAIRMGVLALDAEIANLLRQLAPFEPDDIRAQLAAEREAHARTRIALAAHSEEVAIVACERDAGTARVDALAERVRELSGGLAEANGALRVIERSVECSPASQIKEEARKAATRCAALTPTGGRDNG